MGNFGTQDVGIPTEKVEEFQEALKKAGKQADIKVFDGAKHGFFNDTRPRRPCEAGRWRKLPKLRHHSRTVSQLKETPRIANISATSRKLGEAKYTKRND